MQTGTRARTNCSSTGSSLRMANFYPALAHTDNIGFLDSSGRRRTMSIRGLMPESISRRFLTSLSFDETTPTPCPMKTAIQSLAEGHGHRANVDIRRLRGVPLQERTSAALQDGRVRERDHLIRAVRTQAPVPRSRGEYLLLPTTSSHRVRRRDGYGQEGVHASERVRLHRPGEGGRRGDSRGVVHGGPWRRGRR